MTNKLEGKIAVVTGGNSGIGAATASSPTELMRLNSKIPRLSSAPRMTITAVIWKKIMATISCDRPA